MGRLKIGDIVARKSYGFDIFFKVADVYTSKEGEENIVTLKGISYRVEADAPESDLVLQSRQSVKEYRKKTCMTAEKKA